MTQALNIHHQLYRGPKVIYDPGNGKRSTVDQDLQICEMVSVGADETRILQNPTKPGIRFTMRMLTDGGDIIVSAENGLNVQLETHVTFADAGDMLDLISVTKTAGSPPSAAVHRWQVHDGNIGVAIV